MTDDLIKRLRDAARFGDSIRQKPDLIKDAADEIERLTVERDNKAAELASLQVAFNDWKVFHSTVRLEVEMQLLRAEKEALRNALHGISLGAQNSMTSKEDLGKEARAALEQTK